jgi:hypothetical protein
MTASTVRRLRDIGETVLHADEDVRGRKVLDDEGTNIGTVDSLMVDAQPWCRHWADSHGWSRVEPCSVGHPVLGGER